MYPPTLASVVTPHSRDTSVSVSAQVVLFQIVFQMTIAIRTWEKLGQALAAHWALRMAYGEVQTQAASLDAHERERFLALPVHREILSAYRQTAAAP